MKYFFPHRILVEQLFSGAYAFMMIELQCFRFVLVCFTIKSLS